MTDKAVSALTSLTGANTATGDLVYIVDISEPSAADRSKKITAEELQNYMKKFPATIGVGGATPAASGAGITFPATVSASSDANTLDDYEEGTFAPIFAWDGTTTDRASSYTNQTGRYTKIGRMVFFFIDIESSAISTGTPVAFLSVSGLPFPSASDCNFPAAVPRNWTAVTLSSGEVPSFWVNSSTSYLYIRKTNATDGVETNVSTWDGGGRLCCWGAYFV
jgi:hypothetical protein